MHPLIPVTSKTACLQPISYVILKYNLVLALIYTFVLYKEEDTNVNEEAASKAKDKLGIKKSEKISLEDFKVLINFNKSGIKI